MRTCTSQDSIQTQLKSASVNVSFEESRKQPKVRVSSSVASLREEFVPHLGPSCFLEFIWHPLPKADRGIRSAFEG